jgi:hypothetical protein
MRARNPKRGHIRKDTSTLTKGGYLVHQFKSPQVRRANRLAAGVSYTCARSRHTDRHCPVNGGMKLDLIRLQVYGTFDELGRHGQFWREATVCPCCGQVDRKKLRLSKSGKNHLEHLRFRRASGTQQYRAPLPG